MEEVLGAKNREGRLVMFEPLGCQEGSLSELVPTVIFHWHPAGFAHDQITP